MSQVYSTGTPAPPAPVVNIFYSNGTLTLAPTQDIIIGASGTGEVYIDYTGVSPFCRILLELRMMEDGSNNCERRRAKLQSNRHQRQPFVTSQDSIDV